ncbi:aminotransferase class III-fold pyridoxal phosphate-dependent enzyme [Amylibacter sp.]|nr:aminotransferase class III-fold pyridoxal phosphate-dependent enzyme [Amylibacter sp.]
MEKGNDLYSRALNVVPGGNSLLSKRREMFAPDQWPAYFESAKGISVVDFDGNQYRDFSHFSVGTCTLGYGHDAVNKEVINCVHKGNMSSLNCPEEIYLAERLSKMHPWSDMVRFARSGGEANAIAVRIARSFTNKSKIAFCGYHGWHDWYLSANLEDPENLDKQLLSGLSPVGVPKELASTAVPFYDGDLEGLEKILGQGDVAAIKMEVMRSKAPTKSYLLNVRELANKYNCLLIFDECTSGFRETFGGIHLNFDVSPDISILGKTLGNGYAITAVLGNKKVMSASQSTFISSTFFTERLGFVAALATLDVMESTQSWHVISKKGKIFKDRVKLAAERHDIKIEVSGMDALVSYNIDCPARLEAKTFVTQEMLSEGFLAGNLFYPSIAHSDRDIKDFFRAFENALGRLNKIITSGKDIRSYLKGPICHSTFERLN